MIKYLLATAALLLPVVAQAQHAGPGHMHSQKLSHGAPAMMDKNETPVRPVEPGQSAFAAIQEIVSLLDASPDTDWSKVDINALRRHLVDMDNVTLHAKAVASPIEMGTRYLVTGTGPVRASIRQMVKAHAATMNGQYGWKFTAADAPEGAVLTITVSRPADLAKVRGLGFIGLMAYGMHHQDHHLMIATGKAPHP